MCDLMARMIAAFGVTGEALEPAAQSLLWAAHKAPTLFPGWNSGFRAHPPPQEVVALASPSAGSF